MPSASFLARHAAKNAALTITPDLLTTQGWSAGDAGSLVSLGLWVSILSLPLGGYLTERIGFTNAMIAIFSLVAAGALFLLPYLPVPIGLSTSVAQHRAAGRCHSFPADPSP